MNVKLRQSWLNGSIIYNAYYYIVFIQITMITKKFFVASFTICALALNTIPVYQASGQSQEKIYSALMINFARGIQWPAGNAGDFVIGVLEYPPLASELMAFSNTIKINTRKIQVKEYSHADDLGQCHILFIPAYKARQIHNILNKLANKPTLIITNKTNLAKLGSGVNFVLVDGKLRYEINTKSIESRGMKISNSLKNMGIIVE